MEVILIKDLKRKGSFGETIDVANGYALNYLIPNGFALVANNANKKRFEQIKDKKLQEVSELRDQLKSYADQINGKTFSMVALSRDGKLYGSVTASVIVTEVIKELPDIKINAGDIIVEEGNIKFVGTYTCKAQFTKDIFATFTFIIESDESDEQPELLEAILDEPEETNNVSEEESDEDINDSEEIIETEVNEVTDVEEAVEAEDNQEEAEVAAEDATDSDESESQAEEAEEQPA